MSITLVGVFDKYSDAEAAAKKIEAAGIDMQSIKLSGGQTESGIPPARASAEPKEEQGAISRFFSELFGSSDAEDAAHYSEAVRRGNAVVTVTVADQDRADEISEVLEDCGAVDVDERVAEWKASGYAPPAGARPMASDSSAKDDTFKVVQEELKIGKQTVEKGGVRVRRHTTETPVEEQVTLRSEKAVVDRKKVDRPANEADLQTAFKDKSIEVRETAEEPMVSKTARVVEEVNVGKKGTERTETVRDKVRRTDVDVENLSDVPERSRSAGAALLRYSGPERRFNTGKYSGAERRMSA